MKALAYSTGEKALSLSHCHWNYSLCSYISRIFQGCCQTTEVNKKK